MFLIECMNDNSYCIVEDDCVYGDEIDSVVYFDWNGKSHEGVIKLKSESQTDLKKKLKELQTIDKANKTPQDDKIKEKRQRKEKRSYSPDETYSSKGSKINYNNSKNKDKCKRGRVKVTESPIMSQKISKLIKKNDKLMAKMNDHDSISDLTDEQSSSPSPTKKKDNVRHRRRDITFLKNVNQNLGKENYRRSASLHGVKEVQLMSQASSEILFTSKAGKQKKLFEDRTKSRNTDNSSDDSVSSNDECDSPDDSDSRKKKSEREEKRDRLQTSTQKCEQLYGKYYLGDEMVHLKYNIYCRKRIFDSTLSIAREVTHLLHCLIEGVFRVEKLLNCTITGQSPRAQGKDKKNEQYDCLDLTAKMAIEEFSLEYGKSKNWSIPSESTIKRSMTQRVGELKNQFLEKQKREIIRNDH